MRKPGCQGRPALLVALVLLALAGCRTDNRVTLDPLKDRDNLAANDPLRGRAPTPAPATQPSSSQARLLTPDLGMGLAGDAKNDSTSPTLGGPSMAKLASGGRIRQEHASSPFGGTRGNDVSAARWTPSSGFTWEQAKEMLKSRGVTWYQLKMGSDGLWHFRCTVPNPENPSLSRVYETSDANDLLAVRKALDNLGQ